MRPARLLLVPPAVAAALILLAGAAPSGATSSPPIQPFLCPDGGPNGGHAPQAMAKSAGHLLVACADTESEAGRGLVATAAAIHEPESATPAKPLFSMVSDAVHLRVEAVPEQGFGLTWESLLPGESGEYAWSPITASSVACGPDGCGERDARCALDLSPARRQDLLGRVRQLTRSGTIEPSVAQRLVDDLTVQALLGDDVAAWTVEQLDRILAIGQQNRDGLAQARQLLERARAARCGSLVFPPDEPPPPPPDPAAQAAELKEKIARSKGRTSAPPATSSSEAPPADLDAVAWLVGGRWEGSGTTPDGGSLHVEEIYRWGPARHSIRFRAQNSGAAAKNASAVEGIVFFESKPGTIVLWNVKPGGGLSESAITRADRNGCEFVGADGRVRLTRTSGDHQNRVVDQLRGNAWTTVVTASYVRRPR
jgi:hypothetical protein